MVNEQQLKIILQMISRSLNGQIRGKRIAILGVAFKKDTDDIRGSISIKLIRELIKKEALLKLHDPLAIENAKKMLRFNKKTIEFYDHYLSCINNAECCIIMTDCEEYKKIHQKDFIKFMSKANVIDVSQIFESSKMNKINYNTIGINKL
jgi:UDPglucose 6-dehydrogenase